MKIYLFIRKEGFYHIELKDDEDAIMNAEINEGTLQVIDTAIDKVIWKHDKN